MVIRLLTSTNDRDGGMLISLLLACNGNFSGDLPSWNCWSNSICNRIANSWSLSIVDFSLLYVLDDSPTSVLLVLLCGGSGAFLKNDVIVWFGDDKMFLWALLLVVIVDDVVNEFGGTTVRWRNFIGDFGFNKASSSRWCWVGDFNVTPTTIKHFDLTL